MRDLESNTLLYSSLLPRANHCRQLFYLNAASRCSPNKQLVIARPQTSANKEMFFGTSMSIAILLPFLLLAAMAATTNSLTECQKSCGDIDIPYPFGIGTNCFHKGFQIDCNNTGSDGPQPFLAGTSIKVVILSADPPIAQVMLPIGRQCYNKSMPSQISDMSDATTSLEHNDVFRISNKSSMLVVLGCRTIAAMVSTTSDQVASAGCLSYCNRNSFNNMEDGACTGTGCCHVDIKPELTSISFEFMNRSHRSVIDFSPCDYAFLVQKNYSFHKTDLLMDSNRTMPVWLDWAIRDNMSIPMACKDAEKTTEYAISCCELLKPEIDNLSTKHLSLHRDLQFSVEGTP